MKTYREVMNEAVKNRNTNLNWGSFTKAATKGVQWAGKLANVKNMSQLDDDDIEGKLKKFKNGGAFKPDTLYKGKSTENSMTLVDEDGNESIVDTKEGTVYSNAGQEFYILKTGSDIVLYRAK